MDAGCESGGDQRSRQKIALVNGKANGIAVGDSFTFRGPDGRTTRLVAKGIFRAPKLDSLLSAIVVTNSTFDRALPRPRDSYAFVDVAGGPSATATRALEAAYASGLIDVAWLNHCPLFETLRTSPRFARVHELVRERASEAIESFVTGVA